MPPVVPLVLAGASIVKGMFDSSRANKLENKALEANKNIPRQDAGVLSLLGDIQQKRRYAESGATKMMALKRGMIQDTMGQTQANLLRASGGNGGTVIDSLLRSQNIGGRAMAQAAADTEQLAPQYMAMQAPLVTDMADRKLSLDTYDRDLAMANAAQARRDANDNIWGAVGLLASADWSAGAAGSPDVPASLLGGNELKDAAAGTSAGATSRGASGIGAGIGGGSGVGGPVDDMTAPYDPNFMPMQQPPLFS